MYSILGDGLGGKGNGSLAPLEHSLVHHIFGCIFTGVSKPFIYLSVFILMVSTLRRRANLPLRPVNLMSNACIMCLSEVIRLSLFFSDVFIHGHACACSPLARRGATLAESMATKLVLVVLTATCLQEAAPSPIYGSCHEHADRRVLS